MTEKLVSKYFPIKDDRLQGGLDMDISQRISLKEVLVTSKPDVVLGYYGETSSDNFFESVFDHNGQQTTRNILTDTGYLVYHGFIVDYNHHKFIKTTAYSVIDLLSASGGLISGIYYSFIPIALTFSRLSFDLGVMSLLFLARTALDENENT